MSGIAGILYPSRTDDLRSRVDAMTRSVAHRGPDHQAIWIRDEGHVALGHTLLATTPEAEYENQPLRVLSDRVSITADLRIDNRDSLIRSLRLGDEADKNLTDPYLLAQSYLRWGSNCVDYIVGDYAFAIWDGRNNRLFCARDPMGVKPFYYSKSSTSFAFASETRSLLTLPSVSNRVNRRHVFAFLSGNYGRRDETYFDGLKRLEPGHRMRVSRDLSVSTERYWKPAHSVDRLDHGDDRLYEEEFKEVLEKAVCSSLRSNSRVGVRLSGGLDSSAIASLMANRIDGSPSSIHSFSQVYPSLPEDKRRLADESQYIDAVLEKYQFTSHLSDASELSPLYRLEEIVKIWGQPFNITGQCYSFEVLEEARRHGIKALLDGSEGDAVVGYGYDLFTKLARQNDWEEFAEIASRYSKNCREGGRTYPPEQAFWDHAFDTILGYLRRGDVKKFYRSTTRASKALDIPYHLIFKRAMYWLWPDGWRKKIDAIQGDDLSVVPPERLRKLEIRTEPKSISDGSPLTRRAQYLQKSRMLTEALESTDPIFAAHHTEARHPLYDRRVIEYCLSLPAEQRFRGGWTRSIMRRGLRSELPGKIKHRLGKGYVGVAISHNLRRFETDRLENLVLDDILRPFVDRETVVGLLKHFRRSDQSSFVHTGSLLRLVVLNVWLQKRKRGRLEGPLNPTSNLKEH
ncbi:asparagine synthase (glutamine-hydrolyzing) [Salinibacter sp.]|jgi:asparagine synthase (glutamine-hydrolysing)|uniref:asparagine synthase (glutamine-hydrolyzing) n=1 Tax=Salinibacter sp. TaxID=2065818 RepID=UPI0021E8870B|nr:asparagine synthase (glutamine-hydrolyzing) [Salinibacter sp.]